MSEKLDDIAKILRGTHESWFVEGGSKMCRIWRESFKDDGLVCDAVTLLLESSSDDGSMN